jgi:hypothetical protein
LKTKQQYAFYVGQGHLDVNYSSSARFYGSNPMLDCSIGFYLNDTSIKPLNEWVDKNNKGEIITNPSELVNRFEHENNTFYNYELNTNLNPYDWLTDANSGIVILYNRQRTFEIHKNSEERWIIPNGGSDVICEYRYTITTTQDFNNTWTINQIAIFYLPRELLVNDVTFLWRNTNGDYITTNVPYTESGVIDVPDEIRRSNNIRISVWFKKPFANWN